MQLATRFEIQGGLEAQQPYPASYVLDTVDRLRRVADDIEAAISRYYGARDDSVGKMIQDITEGEVEIGWTFLERAFWGGAYNRELKSLMIQHALRFVHRVVFIVGEKNLRSQRALEKIGAKFLREMDRPGPDGNMRRNVVFAITR